MEDEMENEYKLSKEIINTAKRVFYVKPVEKAIKDCINEGCINYLDEGYDFEEKVHEYPTRRRSTNRKYKSTRYVSDVVKNMRAIRKNTLGNVECARNVQKIKGRIMYGW